MSGLAQCSPWCLEAWPPSRLRSPGSRWPWRAVRSPITALQAPAKAWTSCELSMVAVGRLQGRSTSTRCPSSSISACEYGVSDIAASIVATLIHGSGIVLSIISIARGASLGSKHSSRWCCSCVALDSRVTPDPPPGLLKTPCGEPACSSAAATRTAPACSRRKSASSWSAVLVSSSVICMAGKLAKNTECSGLCRRPKMIAALTYGRTAYGEREMRLLPDPSVQWDRTCHGPIDMARCRRLCLVPRGACYRIRRDARCTELKPKPGTVVLQLSWTGSAALGARTGSARSEHGAGTTSCTLGRGAIDRGSRADHCWDPHGQSGRPHGAFEPIAGARNRGTAKNKWRP